MNFNRKEILNYRFAIFFLLKFFSNRKMLEFESVFNLVTHFTYVIFVYL